MDFLIFGIQGAGKGTQAKALALALNLPIFETGSELRKIALEDSTEGHEVKKIITKGLLVPAGILLLKVADYLENPATTAGVIFDGIPRTVAQAISFDEMLLKLHRDWLAINIVLGEEAALKRLEQRRICSKCGAVFMPDYTSSICNHCAGLLIHRADDNADAIANRFQKYKVETMPVIDHYRKQGKLITVDGNQAVLDVTKDIFNQLSPLIKLHTPVK